MKKFISKTIIEDYKHEVSINEYENLVIEMQHDGFEKHNIIGMWERDSQTIYLVSFQKEI